MKLRFILPLLTTIPCIAHSKVTLTDNEKYAMLDVLGKGAVNTAVITNSHRTSNFTFVQLTYGHDTKRTCNFMIKDYNNSVVVKSYVCDNSPKENKNSVNKVSWY